MKQTRRQKVLDRMVTSVITIASPLNSSWIEFLFITVVPKYLKCYTFSNGLFAIPILACMHIVFFRFGRPVCFIWGILKWEIFLKLQTFFGTSQSQENDICFLTTGSLSQPALSWPRSLLWPLTRLQRTVSPVLWQRFPTSVVRLSLGFRNVPFVHQPQLSKKC
jgi:hypothetical protein